MQLLSHGCNRLYTPKKSSVQARMANDKTPLGQLRDLVELKDQLEDIQKRMEDEIHAGVPAGGSLLGSPFLKGFLAGYIVARFRSSALLGVAIGACTGIYAAQNYKIPNVENTVKDYISNLKGRR
ncbi:SLC35A4 upstream open reading frame protein-like [Entelurus aequoreus]|uniref:SLC35A4 upstream open reading frame protein-like n=2 Tax=Syngnathinae TaxID=129914 RepID=UPI002B1DE3BE|nr:SLC35A4 upstream open reading frame protein-like [Entelurus aequoreus]